MLSNKEFMLHSYTFTGRRSTRQLDMLEGLFNIIQTVSPGLYHHPPHKIQK